MSISCDPDETIQVIRANYGRFSIAICNKHGYTEWSVNCIAHQTTRILQRRCDGEQDCSLPVNSNIFGGDPCPGTRKYVEVHYACSSKHPMAGGVSSTTRRLPPWLLKGRADDLWNEESEIYDQDYENYDDELANSRKPILIQLNESQKTTSPPPLRIPITTPKSTTTVSTTTTTSETTTLIGMEETFPANEANEMGDETNGVKAEVILDEVNTLERVSSPMEHMDISSSDIHSANIEGQACPPVFFRHLYWNWTQTGQTAIQPCPKGSTGLASWQCGSDGDWSVPTPDLGDCKSTFMSNLEVAVRKEDPEEVIVSKLVQLTAPPSPDAFDPEDNRPLFGGDVEAAVKILESVSNRLQYKLQSFTRDHQSSNVMYNKQSHVQQIFQNVLRASSHLLSDANRQVVWGDLKNVSRVKLASELMQVVESHAFLLSEVIPEEDAGEVITESSNEISMSLSVIDTRRTGISSEERQQAFHGFGNDSIYLPYPEANHPPSPLKTVFFSYNHLHELFQGSESGLFDHYELNSRIVSASFQKPRSLMEPVRLELAHLKEVWPTGRASENKCVFWDTDASSWSEKGCFVIESNANSTVCACDHLTSFAVLSPKSSVGVARVPTAGTDTALLMEIVICLLAVIFIVLLALLAMRFRRSFIKSCCSSVTKGEGCCVFCRSYRERCHHHDINSSKGKPMGASPANNNDDINNKQMKLNMATIRGAVAVPVHPPHHPAPLLQPHLGTTAHPSHPLPHHQPATTKDVPRHFISSTTTTISRPPLHQSMDELSSLPHTTLRRHPTGPQGTLAFKAGDSTISSTTTSITINPFPSPKHRPTLPRPADNYSPGSRAQESRPPTCPNTFNRYVMSPQLARLTNTLKRNSESCSPLSHRDLSCSTASYQNVSTDMSELPSTPDHEDTLSNHVYMEIPHFSSAEAPPGVWSPQRKPAFAPKPLTRRQIQNRKSAASRRRPHNHLYQDSDEDTASDLHNLTDFSEDEDKIVETSNSDMSGRSTSSSSMGGQPTSLGSNRLKGWSPAMKIKGQLRKQSSLARDDSKFNPSEFDFNGKVTVI